MEWLDFTQHKIELHIREKDTTEKITDISQFPEGTHGFVYLIEYTDGTLYIGKKNLYSIKTMAPLKNGKVREGTIKQTFKIGSGKRVYKDIVKKESDWKTYQGSHADCKAKTVKKKYIIALAKSMGELTYLEAKYLFAAGVLEDDNYLNDNILGRFYKGHIYDKENNP